MKQYNTTPEGIPEEYLLHSQSQTSIALAIGYGVRKLSRPRDWSKIVSTPNKDVLQRAQTIRELIKDEAVKDKPLAVIIQAQPRAYAATLPLQKKRRQTKPARVNVAQLYKDLLDLTKDLDRQKYDRQSLTITAMVSAQQKRAAQYICKPLIMSGVELLEVDPDMTQPDVLNKGMEAASNRGAFGAVMLEGDVSLTTNMFLATANYQLSQPGVKGVFGPRLPRADSHKLTHLSSIAFTRSLMKPETGVQPGIGVMSPDRSAILVDSWNQYKFNPGFGNGGAEVERMKNEQARCPEGATFVYDPGMSVYGPGPKNTLDAMTELLARRTYSQGNELVVVPDSAIY